jgi:putative NAD(P)H nitroreductase
METIQAINERRSINFFDPSRSIPRAQIAELLKLANLSPSSFNLQPWEVIVVDDPERKKTLRQQSYNQAKVEEASAVLIIIANPNGVEENIDPVLDTNIKLGYMKAEAREATRKAPFAMYGEKDSLKRKFFAVKNTSFFAMSIMIAARGMGYETHPMDGFDEEGIKKNFNIPDDRIIPLLIAVGYPKPDLKLLPRAYRRDIENFTKYNKY